MTIIEAKIAKTMDSHAPDVRDARIHRRCVIVSSRCQGCSDGHTSKVDHSKRDSLCSLATSGQSYCRGTRQVELTGQADLTSSNAIADFNLPYQRRWDKPLLSEDEVDLKRCALQQTTTAPRGIEKMLVARQGENMS